jgi:hypothetical protein
MTSSSS